MNENNTSAKVVLQSPGTEPLADEDLEILSPKEQAVERKAAEEEMKKRQWMADPVRSVAARVPVSVFALGDLCAAS